MEGVEILDTVARDVLPGKEVRQCEQRERPVQGP